MFKKILIANRGEIACRVIRAARATTTAFALTTSALAGPAIAAQEEHLRAVQLDEAIDQFASICLSTFPDKSRFDAAAKASVWTFARGPTPDDQTRDEWDAPKGVVYFIGTGGMPSGKALPQCNLDFAIPTALDRMIIAERVETKLAAVFGTTPPRGEEGGFIFWEWSLGTKNVARLFLVQFKGADPRALTLSLQTWRTPLLPASKKSEERGN